MKRAALVDYSSSDDNRSESEMKPPESPPAKKRKLPSLSRHLLPQIPVDDPSQHQGRKRTTAHVEGQFAAYVYIPVLLSKRTKLHKLLLRMYRFAKREVAILHPVGFSDTTAGAPGSDDEDEDTVELHISLTRPTYLRAHQREEFKRAVRQAARSQSRFSASFATISELTNDERTRSFLTLEVGAGHEECKVLSSGLTPALRMIRQKEFYEDPRFHVSFAWALLDSTHEAELQSESNSSSTAPVATTSASTQASPTPAETPENARPMPLSTTFPTIPQFPPTLVPRLRAEFSRDLTMPGVATFEAEELHVRIGKDISKWRLVD